MKKKWIKYSILVIFVVLLFLAFSFLRFKVDRTSFLVAFDVVLENTISSIWGLITTPTIFISILITFLLLKYQSAILAIIPGLREIKAGPVSALFESPAFLQDKSLDDLPSSTQENKASSAVKNIDLLPDDKKSLEAISRFVGIGSVTFLLDLDGQILTVKQSIEKFKQHITVLNFDSLSKRSEEYQFAYYFGCYTAYMNYIGNRFVSRKVSEDNKTAYYSLKPSSRDVLNARMNEYKSLETSNK